MTSGNQKKCNYFFGFFYIMDRIITMTVYFFLGLHLSVPRFTKLKTGESVTLFSGEPLFKGHLYEEAGCFFFERGRLTVV